MLGNWDCLWNLNLPNCSLPGAMRVATTRCDYRNFSPQKEISQAFLQKHFPQTVKVIHADKHEAIAQLVAASEQFDFVFHDNGHSGDDYVRDFSELLQLMPSGAVFVLDDIRWYGHGQQQSQRTCYEGWLEIIRHHRVAAALEIEGSMGLILLR